MILDLFPIALESHWYVCHGFSMDDTALSHYDSRNHPSISRVHQRGMRPAACGMTSMPAPMFNPNFPAGLARSTFFASRVFLVLLPVLGEHIRLDQLGVVVEEADRAGQPGAAGSDLVRQHLPVRARIVGQGTNEFQGHASLNQKVDVGVDRIERPVRCLVPFSGVYPENETVENLIAFVQRSRPDDRSARRHQPSPLRNRQKNLGLVCGQTNCLATNP